MGLAFATSITGVITAVGSLLTGAAVVMTAWRLLLPIRQTTAEVHTLVNQQHDDLLSYIAVLVAALRAAGLDVPDDPADPRTPPPPQEA